MTTGTEPTGTIAGVDISTDDAQGLQVTVNGRPASIAIVNEDGNVVTSGDVVAREIEAVVVNGYQHFLRGRGFQRVRAR